MEKKQVGEWMTLPHQDSISLTGGKETWKSRMAIFIAEVFWLLRTRRKPSRHAVSLMEQCRKILGCEHHPAGILIATKRTWQKGATVMMVMGTGSQYSRQMLHYGSHPGQDGTVFCSCLLRQWPFGILDGTLLGTETWWAYTESEENFHNVTGCASDLALNLTADYASRPKFNAGTRGWQSWTSRYAPSQDRK